MSLLNLKKFGFLAAGVGLFAIVAAQGCSSDDTQAKPSAGAGGKSNAGAGGKPTAGTGGSTGGTENGGSAGVPDDNTPGGDSGEGGEGGEAAVDPGCIGADGCYSCKPTTNSQFLNACVEGGWPDNFDNSTLSKIDLVGTL